MINFSKKTKITFLVLTLSVLNFAASMNTYSNNQQIKIDCAYKTGDVWFCGLGENLKSLLLLFILNFVFIVPILNLAISKNYSRVLRTTLIILIGLFLSYFVSFNLILNLK